MKRSFFLFGLFLLLCIPVSTYAVTYQTVQSFDDWNHWMEQGGSFTGPAEVTRLGNALDIKIDGTQGSDIGKLYDGSIGMKAVITVKELSDQTMIGIGKYIGSIGSNLIFAGIYLQKFLDYYVARYYINIRNSSHQELDSLNYGHLGKWEAPISGKSVFLSFELMADTITFYADDFSTIWTSAIPIGPPPADNASIIAALGFEETSNLDATVQNVSIAYPEAGDIAPTHVIEIGNDLSIQIPLAEYQGQLLGCTFGFKGGIAEDPGGLYWKLDPTSLKFK